MILYTYIYIIFIIWQALLPNISHSPAAAAKVVFMATWAASAPSVPDFMVSVLPGLKPYQPNHRAKVPNLVSGAGYSGFS
jgi:hypothetical protein